MNKKIINLIVVISSFLLINSVKAESFLSNTLNLPYSDSVIKIDVNSPSPMINNDFTLTGTKVSVGEATLAEFETGLDCKTGDIKISGAIPDIKNFKQAMGLFAPFAVDENGEVNFGNFFKEILSEIALQEVTEGMLDYLGYLHFYITSYLNPLTSTPSAKIFNSASFKSCVKSTKKNASEDRVRAGASSAAKDDFHIRAGIDITALFKYHSCYTKNKGPILKGGSKEEKERFDKSKKIVRAMFYKFLNSQFDFKIQSSELCKQYTNEVYSKVSKNQVSRQNELQFATSGQMTLSDGSKITTGVQTETIYVLEEKAGEDSSVSPKEDLSKKKIAQATAKTTGTAGDKAVMKTGSTQSVKKVDFQTSQTFRSSPNTIDILDLNPMDRIKFFKKTKEDFINRMEESEFFIKLSSNSKYTSKKYLNILMRMQQINYGNVDKLSCAINVDNCDFEWITDIEHDIMMNNNGSANICITHKEIDGVRICMEEKPYRMIKDIKKDMKVSKKEEQQEYMRKVVFNKMTTMVETFYKMLGGFIFEEDYSTADRLTASDYLKTKITFLKYSKLLNEYWTSPISSLSPLSIIYIKESITNSQTDPLLRPRSEMFEHIRNITKQIGEDKLSFTPYIYEPANELQMAKLLYSLSSPARINMILHSTSQIRKLELENDKFDNPSTNNDLIEIISAKDFQSIFSKIEYEGHDINPFILHNNDLEYKTLSIEELDSIAIITEKYKDFYIKRLLDLYSGRFHMVKKALLKNIGQNQTKAALNVYRVDLNRADFKMQQRREMLKLLLY